MVKLGIEMTHKSGDVSQFANIVYDLEDSTTDLLHDSIGFFASWALVNTLTGINDFLENSGSIKGIIFTISQLHQIVRAVFR